MQSSFVVGSTSQVENSGLDQIVKESEDRFYSEEQYRTLAETIPQLVWTAAADGRVDYLNRRWQKYTDVTPQGTQQTLNWRNVLHEDDADEAIARWNECVKSGSELSIESRLRRGNTDECSWFLIKSLPIRTPSGDVMKWFGTCTNIDEQKRVNQMKDDFLATMSHELRTPLNIILGHATLLATGSNDPREVEETAKVIQRHTRIQIRLVNDLLDFSAILSGKLRIAMQNVELTTLVKECVDSFQFAAAGRKIKMKTTVSQSQIPVSGDPQRLQQVVWNLVSNAIKFTPDQGHIEVEVSCHQGKATFSITDSGKGIEAEFLPHVFERFRQEDASTRRQFGGMGIGLSIAKELVELHGGFMRVESDGLGKGTKTTVTLPALTPAFFTNEKVIPLELESLR